MGKKNSVLYQSSGWTKIAAKRQTHHPINKVVPVKERRAGKIDFAGSMCFKWNDREGEFKFQPKESGTPLSKDNQLLLEKVKAVVKKIKKDSGIKRLPMKIIYFVFMVICLSGFSGAYFLILSGNAALGSSIIVFTSLVVFFLLFGYIGYLGSQMERVTSFFQNYDPNIILLIKGKEFRFIVNHSFHFTSKL